MTISDAAMARLRDTLERPEPGPRYDVGGLLGRGGMGAVYRAHDRELEREVAIKVLAIDADTGIGMGRLDHEARLLAQLEHPGIVTVYDRGSLEDGRPYYVMRLVRGERLDEYSRRVGRGELLRVFLRVCDAVAFAHARGILHRDLKPSNVMVGEFGEALVLDWGIATRMSEPGALAAGTPGFMAPEQAAAEGAEVDARADVHGLGAILRAMLRERQEPLPSALGSIVRRATAFAPRDRYGSATELADDVRRWLDGEPVAAHREGPLERVARVYRRNQVLILLLLTYAVVRVAILLWRGV